MLAKKQHVDFLIIGAGKSGTTSLFRYLSAHPQIYMPPEKEPSFFALDRQYEKGFRWYLNHYFGTAAPKLVWGEASPAYMIHETAASRIWKQTPGCKLIAILREPVSRAYSHYCHLRREGIEKRSFRECIEQFTGANADSGTASTHHCIAPSCYGRVLGNFMKFFPRQQLRIVFFEDLTDSPRKVVRDLFGWLGVDEEFEPPTLGRVFNVGGRLRFPWLTRRAQVIASRAARTEWLNDMLHGLRLRRTLAHWWIRFQTEIAVRPIHTAPLPSQERRILTDYFATDVRELEELIGRSTPWKQYVT